MPNAPQILPQNDKALIKAVREGRFWPPVDELPTPEQLADATFVATMPTIQATSIRALCLGLWDDVIADPKGVQVVGARIVGELDLSFGTGRGPLALLRCHFAEELVVLHAYLPALNLSGSHLAKGLRGDGVHIAGCLFCNDGFTSKGEVRLLGAQIGRDVYFNKANLDGGTGAALSADRMVVTGGVFCSEGFTSKGEVRLLGAQIGGTASFNEANLDGGTGDALSADRMVVNGNLFCRNGFTSKGEVRLLGAQINGNVEFDGAKLNGGEARALNADSMVVRGNLFCRNGFTSKGEVLLLGAQINGNVEFDGAKLNGGEAGALNADGMVVDRDLYLRDTFQSTGKVNLIAAKIGGLLGWCPTKGTGELNLSHATAGQWADDWDNEKKKAGEKKEKPTLNLNHFTYGAFAGDGKTKTDSATRIAWIEASQGDDFKPGPYRTLARVLRAAGDDRGAQDVGLALARARAKHLAKTYSWPLNWLHRLLSGFFDVAIGHGYRPWRGAVWLLYLQIIGTIAFGLNAPTIYDCTPNGDCHNIGGPGLIKPADPVFITENQTRNLQAPSPTAHDIAYTLPPEYTPFNAFWYSFDTLIPLIDLGQEKAWSPSPLTAKFSDDIPGWGLLFYLYFHIIMGWVLSTLTVVALTGLIKRDPEGEE
ncbi:MULTISPECIES: hypothetical protein [unclassified Azospirillum]|uniref:hypothetical protein n=1 Tax=unclassified Azospirillum TaxID=2630922 RepID=UPI000B6A3C22|nr:MULTISPECIES: hypothetical protein [unclassified Azospirillum]SNS51223.1 hypothetical protein SAMN05880556_10671 [Azospirillum sp. RU38E]SNS70374.1 hypothetical protein SAMN05880591_10665 [Azospirillum sp. RU37A]